MAKNDIGNVHGELQNFTIKDLQRACIVRGMKFDEVTQADIWKLQSFYIRNAHVTTDNRLLDKYDEDFESEMALQGKGIDNPDYAWMYHPDLRMGFYEGTDDTGKPTGERRPRMFKKPEEPKPKRERLKSLGGIFSGTKKAMTTELTISLIRKRREQGEEINQEALIRRITKKVLEAFPDANEKSIRIWYSKAKSLA